MASNAGDGEIWNGRDASRPARNTIPASNLASQEGYIQYWLCITLTNKRQSGLRNLFVEYEGTEDLTGDCLKSMIQEDLTPVDFAHPDIVVNPEIYKRLKRFLESRGIQCSIRGPSGRFVPRKIIVSLYLDCDEHKCGRAPSIYDAAKRGEDVILSPQTASQEGNDNQSTFHGTRDNHRDPGEGHWKE